MYEHDSLAVELKKISKKARNYSSYSHSPAEHDKCNLSDELYRLSFIVCLYGRHYCNILYVEFQHIFMSHIILNILKFNVTHKL
jgi:hypothetical protein